MSSMLLRNKQALACRDSKHSVSRGACLTRRTITGLALACLAAGLGGCANMAQNISDYLNLRNSFLQPSEVGRFDKANPWGDVQPVVRWPILPSIDVEDTDIDDFAGATDPTPADTVAHNKEFAIGPGDLLNVSVYDLQQAGVEWLKQLLVSESGTIDIYNLGPVQVAGLTPTQIDEKIGQLAVDNHIILPKGNGQPGPQVSVTLVQSRARIFSVLGSVGHPGQYNVIGSDTRLLSALAMAGDMPVQPGLDYIYVIRPASNELPPAAAQSLPTSGGGAAPATTGNPLDTIQSIEGPASAPASAPAGAPPASAPATAPATTPAAPGAKGPAYLGPLPTADAMPGAAAAAPAATLPAAPADGLLNQAAGGNNQGRYVTIDGKTVLLPPASAPASAPGAGAPAGTAPMAPAAPLNPASPEAPLATAPAAAPSPTTPAALPPAADAFAAAEQTHAQRVIRIPVGPLRAGDPRYNIVIQPGDIINVPPGQQGVFYMMGHINRPGVFSLTGQKVTLKEAVAAAGSLDALAIPRRCEITRHLPGNREAIIEVNLQAVFDGDQPDLYLKPDDMVNFGTDFVSSFLAITRNAYRLSYGFGFVYDRNFYIQPNGQPSE